MLRYQLFPRSVGMDETIKQVIECFDRHISQIDSPTHTLKSDEVLKTIAPELKDLGFSVEEGKASEDKIKVPVLFSINNRIDKFFDADAVSADGRIVLEVEARQAFRQRHIDTHDVRG